MEGEGGQRVPRTSPLQIWHITLKRPQARVRIDNENALEERETSMKVGHLWGPFRAKSECVGL